MFPLMDIEVGKERFLLFVDHLNKCRMRIYNVFDGGNGSSHFLKKTKLHKIGSNKH
jgi:hypothetical protein